MNYSLAKTDNKKEKEKSVLKTMRQRLFPLLKEEGRSVTIAMVAIFIDAVVSLLIPFLIAHIVDFFIVGKDFHGVVSFSWWLVLLFFIGFVASYVQIVSMGGVGRRLLFRLRNKIFEKLQELPVAFFHQNKVGDIISRINNDTEKLNQFFSQALMRFMSNSIIIFGTGVFILFLHPTLGLLALIPAGVALIITQILSPWVKRSSLKSLRTLGDMSGEIQESVYNFKVIVAFDRLDYFRRKFKEVNDLNYTASIRAGIASNIFNPLYVLASLIAQLFVLAYGIVLIEKGQFTIGLLIGFLLYVNNFYTPLRQLASVWSSLQLALAGLDRIFEILHLKSNMKIVAQKDARVSTGSECVIEFQNVFFRYSDGKEVLKNIQFSLKREKTYALVGPTGGGKTTTASLIARLYDPTEGTVFLEGRDIRSYDPHERAGKIGFILQEPFILNGTVRENIVYGNPDDYAYTDEALKQVLSDMHLDRLLAQFPEGLQTNMASNGGSISLGQKQLIAFIRAVLRSPDVLILDEATANIDTVTEELLTEIIEKLPKKTTKVIIAHRLNTIENADEIFFVNNGEMTLAGSMQHAIEMLLDKKENSS